MRRFVFDCARAFGKEEAWITDEYHGWFGVLADISDGFEDWLKSKSNVDGFPDEALEYIPDSFSEEGVRNFHYSAKYHDTFEGEPKKRLAQLSAQFHGYEILTIRPYGHIILGRKADRLYAIDIEKEELFVDYPINGIRFHSFAVEIYKEAASALFSYEGNQITPYGHFDYQWKWSGRKNSIRTMCVTNTDTGESWTFPID